MKYRAYLNSIDLSYPELGLVTIVGAIYIWKSSYPAVFITSLVGGLADIGYFVFIVLGGLNHVAPGTVMTIVSAIGVSFIAYFKGDRQIGTHEKMRY
ncbi:hypothetical protein OAP14_09150 [Aliiglaciecola sp.]|nr:hypothetical protein [Aliiglaciecola sp.]